MPLKVIMEFPLPPVFVLHRALSIVVQLEHVRDIVDSLGSWKL